MTVTTLITTYKRPHFLKKAMASVLNQTHPTAELHICDNASEDETRDVVASFKDPRVKYHVHPQNLGMLANYFFAFSQVKTPYFSFLSDDDVLLPWFYEEAFQRFKECPEAQFVATSTHQVTPQGKFIAVPASDWKREGIFQPGEGALEMIGKYPVPTGIVFRTECLTSAQIDKENPLTWDCDFLLQLAARSPFFLSKRPCALFLCHETSYSRTQPLPLWRDALQKISDRLMQNPSLSTAYKKEALQLIRQDLQVRHRSFIFKAFFEKQFKQAYLDADLFQKEYGWSRMAFLLLVLIPFCSWFPPAFQGMRLVRKLKDWKTAKKYHAYKSYLEYL